MALYVLILELNDIIKKLDAAADTAAKSLSTFTPDRKQRVETSDSSVLPPPADAPDWALKLEYRKGEIRNYYSFYEHILLFLIMSGPKLANKENEVAN